MIEIQLRCWNKSWNKARLCRHCSHNEPVGGVWIEWSHLAAAEVEDSAALSCRLVFPSVCWVNGVNVWSSWAGRRGNGLLESVQPAQTGLWGIKQMNVCLQPTHKWSYFSVWWWSWNMFVCFFLVYVKKPFQETNNLSHDFIQGT